MRVEKLSRIWQHCDALGVSATLCGAKDERRAFHDREKAGEVSLGGKGEGRHPREARRGSTADDRDGERERGTDWVT